MSETQKKLQKIAEECRDEANSLPEGRTKANLVEKAADLEATARLEGWLSSPGLQPPR
jgi:hypothetical protein